MRPSVRDKVAHSVTSASCYFRTITDVQKNFQWLQKFKGMKQAQVQGESSRQTTYNHQGILRCLHFHYLRWSPGGQSQKQGTGNFVRILRMNPHLTLSKLNKLMCKTRIPKFLFHHEKLVSEGT